MQPAADTAGTSPIRHAAWLRVAEQVALGDLRSVAPGAERRSAVVDAMHRATTDGARDALARLRAQLDAAGAGAAKLGVRELLWADGGAVLDVEVPAGSHDVARAVADILDRAGARAVDVSDLPGAQQQFPSGMRDAGIERDADSTRGQWFLGALGFDAAAAAGLTGQGVRVAVVDSGIDSSHPELSQALARGGNHDRFAGQPLRSGHGTFVAGILAGQRTGVAPGVDLVSSRTYGASFGDHRGEDAPSRYAQRVNAIRALQDAVAPADGRRGADLVVASWGILDAPGVVAHDYDQVMATLAAAGVVVVAAAGNDGGSGTIAVPAQLDDVLAVGGVDRELRRHEHASAGPSPRTGRPKPDLAAPVVDIRSTAPGGGRSDTSGQPHRGFAGTSAAAPIVAGALAMLAQAVGELGGAAPDLDEVRDVLPLITRDVEAPGPDASTGFGVIDVHRIRSAAAAIVRSRAAR